MISMHSQSAFSLVELSIVLVILGLLTGGILGGQALIRAAELRAVSTEHNRWVTAIRTFQDKYFALPGDMTNATAFWGAADGNNGIGSDCRGAQTLDRRTCNGNGDGFIRPHPDLEDSRVWQHLSNAGLIEGSYVGTGLPYVTACNVLEPGCAVPGSKFKSGLWSFFISDNSYIYPPYQNRNAFALAKSPHFGNNRPQAFIMSGEEAWNIDSKIDDGSPGTGMVTISRIHYCDTSPFGNVSDAARTNARYNFGSTWCVPFFMW